jgi:hypothetical protein
MYYYADMSYEEIASALGVTVNTVGSNVTKAKRKLKKRMETMNTFTNAAREKEIVGGIAMGPAILSAFELEVDGMVTAAQIDTVLTACGTQIADLAVAGAGHALAGQAVVKAGIGGIKLAIIAVSVPAVIGTAAIAGPDIMHVLTAGDSPPAVTEEVGGSEAVLPDAEIVLSGSEEGPSRINPNHATLNITSEGWKPILWRIMDADGNMVEEGEGDTIGETSFALAPGVYAVEWVLENSDGKRAVARREIEILEIEIGDVNDDSDANDEIDGIDENLSEISATSEDTESVNETIEEESVSAAPEDSSDGQDTEITSEPAA